MEERYTRHCFGDVRALACRASEFNSQDVTSLNGKTFTSVADLERHIDTIKCHGCYKASEVYEAFSLKRFSEIITAEPDAFKDDYVAFVTVDGTSGKGGGI